MNEYKQNDKPDIDHRVNDLLNGGVDGELNKTEQDELDRLLAGSEKVRDLNEELMTITGLLDQVPEREPPEYLQSAIESQVRLPVPGKSHDEKQGFFGTWLPVHWLRTGLALTAGVILTVGVYEMGSEPMTDRDAANLVGTVVKSQVTTKGQLLGSIQLNTDMLTGLVELRNTDDLFILDVQLDSEGPSELVVDFAGRGLEFEDIDYQQDRQDRITVTDGSINVASGGEQSYSLKLRRTSEVLQAPPLALEFFANNKLVRKAELSVSQQ